MIELSEPPVDELQDLLGGVDDDVLRLHVSMHDPLAMAVIQSLEQLIKIVAYLQIVHGGNQ